MKIFFPFRGKDIGGTSIFAKKFKNGMEKLGHEVFFHYRPDYDILFMIAQAPFKYLLEAKRRKIPIVQRLDGVFYFSVSSWKFPFFNLKAALIRHFFTDFTVYQSQYSRYSAEKFLGKKKDDPSTIIYNGVATDLFSPLVNKLLCETSRTKNIFHCF
jgi:glycosyltransferase involved in cell wall biosynthesis